MSKVFKITIGLGFVLLIATGAVIIWRQLQLAQTSTPPPVTEPMSQQPLVDPLTQNVLNYQLEEKPSPAPADPNDGYPRQLILNQFNHLTNGNIEIKIQTDSKRTTDKKATCHLTLNGQDYQTVKVELNNQFATCRPFLIHESDIKNGNNNYEVFYQAIDYKDRYAGEINKR